MSVVESLEFLSLVSLSQNLINILNKFINDSEAVFIIHKYPLICISNNPSIVDNSLKMPLLIVLVSVYTFVNSFYNRSLG